MEKFTVAGQIEKAAWDLNKSLNSLDKAKARLKTVILSKDSFDGDKEQWDKVNVWINSLEECFKKLGIS